jgi:hypothetical protein
MLLLTHRQRTINLRGLAEGSIIFHQRAWSLKWQDSLNPSKILTGSRHTLLNRIKPLQVQKQLQVLGWVLVNRRECIRYRLHVWPHHTRILSKQRLQQGSMPRRRRGLFRFLILKLVNLTPTRLVLREKTRKLTSNINHLLVVVATGATLWARRLHLWGSRILLCAWRGTFRPKHGFTGVYNWGKNSLRYLPSIFLATFLDWLS